MASKQGRRQFGWVRVLPSGRYQASYVGPDGLRRLAPSTYANKTDAQNWLTLRQAELLRGEWSNPDLGRVELGDYGVRWIAEHRLSERTRELYEGLFRLHVRPVLGQALIMSLSSAGGMKIKIKKKIKITHACRQRQIIGLVLIWIHACGSRRR